MTKSAQDKLGTSIIVVIGSIIMSMLFLGICQNLVERLSTVQTLGVLSLLFVVFAAFGTYLFSSTNQNPITKG